MSKTVPILAVILVVAALGALLVLSLGGDEGAPVPLDEPGPKAREASDTPTGAARPTRVDGGGGNPRASRPPTRAPRHVLRAGWLGTRPPEYRPQEREAPLEPPPFEPVLKPADKPLVRTIRVTGTRPVHMEVRDGTPFGSRKFTPEADGDAVAFRLEDPIGGRGPRILRFALDKAGDEFVERFLPPGTGAHTFRIGEPGTITGRISNAMGKPTPGTVWADGEMAQADFNGDFALRGIHTGQAVVIARAPGAGHMDKRCLLRCPGGPYPIRVDSGVDLKVAVQPLTAGMALADVVPGNASTVPDDYAAEAKYGVGIPCGVKETISGLPRDFVGILTFAHDRYAARLIRLAPPLTDRVRVTLTPRTVISGEVRDAETTKPIEGEIRVTTSADETTLYDLAVAKQHAPRPTDAWRHPIPDLSWKLVDIDRAPKSGKSFEIHADPALRRIGVRVEAEGYFPLAKNAIKLDGGTVHLVFKLRRDRPIQGASVVLELPPPPPGGWGGLVLEGTLKRKARIDLRRGQVHFTGLMPGLYFFLLDDEPDRKPLRVEIEAGTDRRLRFPE
jgi:hypothetical protein